MAQRITKRVVDALATPAKGKRTRVYDDRLPGFGVVVYPSGRKAFVVDYGPAKARKRITVGTYGPLTVDAARARATEILAEVTRGSDPNANRRAQRHARTFGEWADQYLEGVKQRKKSSREDVRYLKIAKKRWGKRPLDQITADDVRKLQGQVTEKRGRIAANRWLASVRACFAAAWRMDLVPSNPGQKVKLHRENEPRSRILSDDEMRSVLGAVDAETNPHVRMAFYLLIETGARQSEVLRARWSDIDLDERLWRIPSPKAGKPQVIPLLDPTVDKLRALPRKGLYVVAGRDSLKPRADLKRPWARIRTAAGLADVRLHDIRRTYGLSVARTAGLHVASKLLRHSDVRVTEQVYAPLGVDDLRDALDRARSDGGKLIQFPSNTRPA